MEATDRAARQARMTRLVADAERLARLGSWELDLATREAVWSDGLFRILGVEPGDVEPGVEALLGFVHPEDRERVAARLESVVERPGSPEDDDVQAEYRVVHPDGSVRWHSAHGRTERDDTERPVRWLGVVRDVTEERVTERELQARYAVSQALREWESFEEGVSGLLRRLGTALEAPLATLWIWDEASERVVCRAFWHAPDVEPGEFEVVTRSLTFRPGEGVPGRLWVSPQPAITSDVGTDPEFFRSDVADAIGVQSMTAFPAVGPDGPVAVLCFYSADRRTENSRVLRTLTGIGSELGRFLARRRAQLEPRRLSDREIEVLQLAASGLSGPEIAERLVLSPWTVKTHFEHIYEKLGVGDRAAAVALALRTGLIQ